MNVPVDNKLLVGILSEYCVLVYLYNTNIKIEELYNHRYNYIMCYGYAHFLQERHEKLLQPHSHRNQHL